MVYPTINGCVTGTQPKAPRFPFVIATNSSSPNGSERFLVTTSKIVSKNLLLCLALAVCFPLCWLDAGSERPEEAANTAALAWLKVVDDGKAVESWQALAAASRESTSQWRWKLGFAIAQRKFGSFTSRKLRSAQTTNKSPGGRSGEFVLLEYDTISLKQGAIIEKLTVSHEPDGQWRVGGYSAVKPES
jgi:hypothetical protein